MNKEYKKHLTMYFVLILLTLISSSLSYRVLEGATFSTRVEGRNRLTTLYKQITSRHTATYDPVNRKRYNITYSDTADVVSLYDIRLVDAGQYIITDGIKNSSHETFSLEVDMVRMYYNPRIPVLGEPINITCNSIHIHSITWHYNSEPIDTNVVHITPVANLGSMITIPKYSIDRMGNYSCSVTSYNTTYTAVASIGKVYDIFVRVGDKVMCPLNRTWLVIKPSDYGFTHIYDNATRNDLTITKSILHTTAYYTCHANLSLVQRFIMHPSTQNRSNTSRRQKTTKSIVRVIEMSRNATVRPYIAIHNDSTKKKCTPPALVVAAIITSFIIR